MGKIPFVACMFLGAIATLGSGGGALYDHFDFWRNGQTATMKLAYPEKKITIPNGQPDWHYVDVKYVSQEGEILMPQRLLSGDEARRLVKGEALPIIYLKTNPKHTIRSRDELPNPWGWLIAGVVLSALALYARKLLLAEHAAAAQMSRVQRR